MLGLRTVSAGHNKAWEQPDKVTINLCWPRNYSPSWSGAGPVQLSTKEVLILLWELDWRDSSHNQSIMSTNINLKTLTHNDPPRLPALTLLSGSSTVWNLHAKHNLQSRLDIGNVKSSREINLYQRKNLNIWMRVEMWLSIFCWHVK